MSERVTVTMEVAVKAPIMEPFRARLPENLKETANFPGCRGVRIVAHKTKPNTVLFIEEWNSEADYHAYIAWRKERGQGIENVADSFEIDIWPTTIAST
jgi:quinol monooxygenase YgiN